MVQSNVKPTWYWLRDLKGTTATLRVRWNLKEIEHPIMEFGEEYPPSRIWDYEEREITLTVPKPKLDAGALSQKTKGERYAVADAIVVLARENETMKKVLSTAKAALLLKLGIDPQEVIA